VHLLSALLNQQDGSVAPILTASGVNIAVLRNELNNELAKLPQVSGNGGDVQLSRQLLNLLNLLLLKNITSSNILEKLNVIEDCFRGVTFFGNRGGGQYQVWTRLFIAKDYERKDQVLGISICGTEHTENDPHWGNRLGVTQLNVSITNKETRHHSLQLNLDKF